VSASDERRRNDVAKLRELAGQSNGRISVDHVTGNPPHTIELSLRFNTAPSRSYPTNVQKVTKVKISLPARYPFTGPQAFIDTPIFHPNVFSSGQICLGSKWIPTENLELLVRRIIQILVFDPSIVNEQSPANMEALSWYQSTKHAHPMKFPSDSAMLTKPAEAKTMTWSEIPAAPADKVVISCPNCSAQLRVPAGRTGNVKCPKCETIFEART
jgi:predicted Zn finger-like uncharacterized protein